MLPAVPMLGVVPDVGVTPGVVLFVEHPGKKCAGHAVLASNGTMPVADALATCNEAITSGVVPAPDLPGVFINRGVLLMTLQRPAEAKRDFNQALALDPAKGEALVNLGIMLIAEGKPAEGVADLDRAIALGTEQLERAYLSRGRGREDLKDVQGAYADYKMAATIRPDWQPAMDELSRFTVVRR